MRYKFTSKISTILFACFSPTVVLASYDQYGFPARCSSYEYCEGEICIRTVFLPNAQIILAKNDQAFYVTDPQQERHHLAGLFDTLAVAKRAALSSENDSPDYRYVLVPNDEIADAFGLNLYSVLRFRDGSKRLAEQFAKIICSKIVEPQEPN